MLPHSVRAFAISEATSQACTPASAETRQKPATVPDPACMPRTKRASTPPLNPRSTTAVTKAMRTHMIDSHKRNESIIHTPLGIMQVSAWYHLFANESHNQKQTE